MTQDAIRMQLKKGSRLDGTKHLADLIAAQGGSGNNLDDKFSKMIEKYDSR